MASPVILIIREVVWDTNLKHEHNETTRLDNFECEDTGDYCLIVIPIPQNSNTENRTTVLSDHAQRCTKASSVNSAEIPPSFFPHGVDVLPSSFDKVHVSWVVSLAAWTQSCHQTAARLA
eukprot:762742-Amphidinium_carterae.1